MRNSKIVLLLIARSVGLFWLARLITRRAVRILCYHGAWLGDERFTGDAMFIRPATFERRLALLRRLGYPVVSLDEAVAGLDGRASLANASVVVTIDDGWYSTYSEMLPALEKHAVPATLYCDSARISSSRPVPNVMVYYVWALAGYPALDGDIRRLFEIANNPEQPLDERFTALDAFVRWSGVDPQPLIENRVFGYMSEDELRAFHAHDQIDVQLHTHNHSLHDMGPDAVRRELTENAEVLGRMLDEPREYFRHFCYPSGVVGPSAIAALDEFGILSSTTTAVGLASHATPRHLLPRFLDGDNVREIEFEAELSGFTYLAREGLGGAIAMLRRRRHEPAGHPARVS